MHHYTFPIFLLMCQVEWALGSGPPRLNVSDELVKSTGGTLYLRCEGSQELHWHVPHIETEYLAIDSTHHPGHDPPFVSVLELEDALMSDTGYFSCFYSAGDRNLETDKENVDSTYIYFNDGKAKFLDDSGYGSLSGKVTENLVIPCRTTLPNINVTLMKDDQEISVASNPRLKPFDPKVGFELTGLVQEDKGMYVCRSDVTSDLDFSVTIKTESHQCRQLPTIMQWKNMYPVVGYRFILECFLLHSDEVTFNWILPNTEDVKLQQDYNMSSFSRDINGYWYQVSQLMLFNTTEADSGDYTCTVTHPGPRNMQCQDTHNVIVSETKTSFIDFNNIEPNLFVQEGKSLIWSTSANFFPEHPIITYYYNNASTNHKIEKSERVSWNYTKLNGKWNLYMSNMSLEDHGTYVLEGHTKDEVDEDSASVLVQVVSAPKQTKMSQLPEYVSPESEMTVSCDARGFPLLSIYWLFSTCHQDSHECSSNFLDIENKTLEMHVQEPGNRIVSNMTFMAKDSGYLCCSVNNSIDSDNDTQPLRISDIDGLFVLRHTHENETQKVSNTANLEMITNDNFRLLCAATKFTHPSVNLTFSGSGQQILATDSEWSWQHVVKGKVTEGHQGTYNCTATPTGGSPVVKTLEVTVRPEEEVKFKPDANMKPKGDTVMVKEKTSFLLNCTVTGTPSPTVTWFKNDKLLNPSHPLLAKKLATISNDGQQLDINYVDQEMNGVRYKCQAKNRINYMTGYLTLQVQSRGLDFGTKAGLSLMIVGMIILGLVVVWLVRRVKSERKFRKIFRRNTLYLFEKGNVDQLNPDCTVDEQAELLPYGQEWEVPRQDIKIGKQLGTGAFGRVVKAVVTGLEEDVPITTVAIKMCKSTADPSQVRSLSLELKIMIHLGKHLNIVNLMGANTANIGRGELWILVEYCRFGNLQSFLVRHRRHFINQIDPSSDKINTASTSDYPLAAGSRDSHVSQPAYINIQGGYLYPSSKKFSLADPPKGRSSPTHTPLVDNSETEQNLEAHNPLYVKVSIDSEQSITSPTSTQPLLDHMSSSASLDPQMSRSDTAWCQRSDSIIVSNPERSPVEAPFSPAPFSPSPFSQLDSSGQIVPGIDSQGNQFPSEVGNIPGVTAPFTTSDLVCWAWQVAQGMDYLSSRKVLHGDLAARNLLLTESNVVKISDFGLSRDIYKKDVYTKKGDDLMPIKWMSVEAIRDHIFSMQSDVWAYGVTLWELFSLGSVPYPGIEVNKDFLPHLEEGYRMDRPKYANQEIYDLLLHCWADEPNQRPTFKQATEALSTLMLPDLRGEYSTMNDQYMRMNEERFQKETDYLKILSSPDFDNLTQGEEAGAEPSNYVNMPLSDDVPDSNKMTSPTATSPQCHYLPMQRPTSTLESQDVFSPRSVQPCNRFTFVEEPEGTPRLLRVVEEDESYTSSQKTMDNSSPYNACSRDNNDSPSHPSPAPSDSSDSPSHPPPANSDSPSHPPPATSNSDSPSHSHPATSDNSDSPSHPHPATSQPPLQSGQTENKENESVVLQDADKVMFLT